MVAAPSGGKTRFSRQHLENYLAKWLVGGLGPSGLDSWDRQKTKGIGIFRDTIEYPDSNPKPPTQKSQIFL